MKTFLAIVLFVIPCFIGVKGQPLDIKALGNRLNKKLNLENMYGISPRGDKHKMQYPKILKIPMDNQLKSTSEGSQKLDSMIYEVWDTVTNQFVISSKTVYSIDTYGHESSEILYYWNHTTSQWYPSWKVETTYDDNGKFILEITNSWDETTNQWLYNEKRSYIFDDYGNVILDMVYVGTNDQIAGGFEYSYSYDSNGNAISDYSVQWDVSLNQWNFGKKHDNTYDGNGNITLRIGYYAVGFDDYYFPWKPYEKLEYTYNSAGNMTSSTNFYYLGNEWHINLKTAFIYDDHGNMVLDSTFYEEFDSYAYKQEHIYNDKGNKTSKIYYFRVEPYGEWICQYRETYYYSEFIPTPVPGIPGKEVRVYPNPAKEYIIFDVANITSSATVELFDFRGKKVLEYKLSGDNRLVISNLPKGIYLYRLHDNGSVYKGKITVE
jgi:hypothetical protein